MYFYLIGISSLDTVERYDPDLDEWKNIARMNKNRSAAGVVHLDGKIYALGGHNGLSIFESVEFYDTRTGGWEGKYGFAISLFLPKPMLMQPLLHSVDRRYYSCTVVCD